MRKVIILLTVLIAACGKKDTEETTTESIKIERFDQELMNVASKEDLQKLLTKNSSITTAFYAGSPTDTAFVSDLFFMAKNQEAQLLFLQAEETFGDLSKIKSDFGKAFVEIKKLYPDFKEPRIVTVFSGLSNDMVVSDSLVVISLEAFIGPKAQYRPQYPDYILKRFTPDYIVPNVIRILSNQFNKLNFDKDNFTTDLIFFGKSLEFSRAVLPHIADSLIIGYSNLEMQNAYEHQDYIWAHILDRELLNSNNPATNSKYFGERSYTSEISRDCPPRIGQWLGWRIVELYRKNNPELSIQKLMEDQNAEEILRGSKYRGQKDK